MEELTPEQVRERLQDIRKQELELEKKQKQLSIDLLELQKRCPHLGMIYNHDPSGNNDSFFFCSDCNAWSRRNLSRKS